ncbi:MAG TPA: transglycosylase SLT domain-containing protein [Terriglobia bacterium]|nr:transglycosylase SLT domain-containing protein [Terriglobia bacterium]
MPPPPLPLRTPSPAVKNLGGQGLAISAKMTAVNKIIDKAESAYTRGLLDYQAGNLEKAKQEFDNSLSALLESPYDVRSDERLSQEFDLLTDNINDVEMIALSRGSPLSEHQYVPTPIESFSGLTFPVDPNVMRRAQQEVRSVHSDIPLVINPVVSGAIAYFQNHARGYVENVLKRLGQYRPMISKALRKEGLPQDLMYLPGPESAFDPHATSRKGAKGLWQLMRGTAELHGLKDNRWVDEREDPYQSTLAASEELKKLYHMFGDWYLALAAYDSGPLTVQRAIQRTGFADYWKLRELHAFPSPETESYVPVYLATALIAKDPKAYGFSVSPDAPIRVDRVTLSAPVDLRLVAELIDTPVDNLVQLNPGLRGYETPPKDPGFALNLPAGTKDLFEQRIAAVPPAERRWWRAVRVDSNDTLASVARKYRIKRTALASANHLDSGSALTAGAYLVIPLAPSRSRVSTAAVRWVRRAYHYRVRKGDNLDLIADRFDVTTYQLRRWNHLSSSRIVAGRTLLVYRLVPVHTRTRRHRHYARHHTSRHHTTEARNTHHHSEVSSGASPAR